MYVVGCWWWGGGVEGGLVEYLVCGGVGGGYMGGNRWISGDRRLVGIGEVLFVGSSGSGKDEWCA